MLCESFFIPPASNRIYSQKTTTTRNMVQGVVINDEGCIININPATGEEISKVKCSTATQITEMIAKANDVQSKWAYESTTEQRINLLKQGLKELEKVNDQLVELIVKEMGKPISEAKEEMEWAIGKDEYMDLLSEALQPKTHGTSTIVRTSYGVVVILSPWNFPVDEILLLALPALASGNTGKWHIRKVPMVVRGEELSVGQPRHHVYLHQGSSHLALPLYALHVLG